MKLACLGDSHIPERAEKIPEWIIILLKKESPDLILFTGDATEESVLNELKSISKLKSVKGNMDWLDLPIHELITLKNHRIILIHGSGIQPRGDLNQLLSLAKKAGADIVVHGHTHIPEIKTHEGVFFLNPGSCCGVFGGGGSYGKESMILIDFNAKPTASLMVDGIEVMKSEF